MPVVARTPVVPSLSQVHTDARSARPLAAALTHVRGRCDASGRVGSCTRRRRAGSPCARARSARGSGDTTWNTMPEKR